MNIADEIQKLEDLRRSGALNEAEFAQAKAVVLASQHTSPPAPASAPPPAPVARGKPPFGCLTGLVIFGIIAIIAFATNPQEDSLKVALRKNREAQRGKDGLLGKAADAALDLALELTIERKSYGVVSIATIKQKDRVFGVDLNRETQVIGFFGRWWLESSDTGLRDKR